MIANPIMYIISQYNEKGVFVQQANKTYWFNGKRFEIWNNMTPKLDYEHCMIQIQIDTKTHSYIISKHEISHFNGERWTNSKINSLPVIETTDCGTVYYIVDKRDITSIKMISQSQTKNHGILYCCKSSNMYLINSNGNLSLFKKFDAHFCVIGDKTSKTQFRCSGHWELNCE